MKWIKKNSIRITLLFFSWQPNTIQTLKRNLNISYSAVDLLLIEMVGFDFYSNPKSFLSLENTEN